MSPGKLFVLIMFFVQFAGSTLAQTMFRPAQIWPDEDGNHINAHCGSILQIGSDYYWFGEDRIGNRYQVTCYKSSDLDSWKFQNIVLKNMGDEKGFIERPKVIYNEQTKKFVMWMHKEGENGYAQARAAVATCDTVDGNYQFLGSFRPLENMSRDCYLFKDDDGKAYFISASANNADLKLYRLTDDYLKIDREILTIFKGQFREAPVVFKRNGMYYLLTSFCTGAKASQQYYSTARSIMGPWSDNRNLCDPRTWNTYDSQGACAFEVKGSKGSTFIFNLDRWVKPMRHVWLPLEFGLDGEIKPLQWHDQWSVNIQTGLADIPETSQPLKKNLALNKPVESTYNTPGRMFDYSLMANHEPHLAIDDDPKTFWQPKDNLPHWLKLDIGSSLPIDDIQIDLAGNKTFDYQIETSEDDLNWTTLVKKYGAKSPVVESASYRSARFIRYWHLQSESGYDWARVSQFTIRSGGKVILKESSISSDSFQAKIDATKAVDGDFSTGWIIDNDRLPQSITIDLQSQQPIGGVRILWASAGTAFQYRVETSTDRTKWERQVDQEKNDIALTQPTHQFKSDRIRYLKLTITGYDDMGGERSKNMRPWAGIRELEILPVE